MLLALAACRSQPVVEEAPRSGDVGVSIVPPPAGAAAMPLRSDQAFVFPNLVEPAAMPEYPPDLLKLRLEPVVVCVEIDIDETGKVFAARPRVDGACPAASGEPGGEFAAAANDAVLRWVYDPALVCSTPDGKPAEDACAVEGAVETPTKIRLSYAFRFSQRDGKPSVERLSGGG